MESQLASLSWSDCNSKLRKLDITNSDATIFSAQKKRKVRILSVRGALERSSSSPSPSSRSGQNTRRPRSVSGNRNVYSSTEEQNIPPIQQRSSELILPLLGAGLFVGVAYGNTKPKTKHFLMFLLVDDSQRHSLLNVHLNSSLKHKHGVKQY